MKTITIELDVIDYPDIDKGELHQKILQAIKSIDSTITDVILKSRVNYTERHNGLGMVDLDELFGKTLNVYERATDESKT
jgi:hypothetical protein